jgi:hypothetical protein
LEAVWDWTRGLESHLHAVVIDPTDSTTLYAGIGDASQFLPVSSVRGLMKSVDGGGTWSNIGLSGSAVTVLAIDASIPRVLYASTEGLLCEPRSFRGLFKSTDEGISWTRSTRGSKA